MLRRLVIALAILIAIPLVFIPCWIVTHLDDLPAVDDADLAVARSATAPGSNGLEHFERAAAALDWPEDADERLKAIREGTSEDPGWVRQLLARNRQAIESLERGVEAGQFVLPPDPMTFGDDDCCTTFLAVQRLLKLSGAQARLDATAGKYAAATERALLALRVGRRISSAEGINLFGMMIATATLTIGAQDLDFVVRASPLGRDAAIELIRDLESTRWTPADWQRMWATEYEHFRALIAETRGEMHESMQFSAWKLVPEAYLWQPRRTLSATAEQYRERQRRSAQSCREAYAVATRDDDAPLATAKLLLAPNAVGNVLLAIAQPNFDRFDMKRCHAETKTALLQALIAVKAFERERGAFPEQLDELVASYLARVPEDRFAGAPLRYSRERKVVWSIGEDLSDASGGERYDPNDSAEPALSLVF